MALPAYVLKGVVRRALGLFGSITTTGINTGSVAAGLVASVTQTRVGGLALTASVSVVATVGSAGDAVTLPALLPGQSVDVYNAAGVNSMKVFPNGATDTIDGGSAGASVNLAATKRCRYTCVAANTIISAQLGVVSA